MRLVIIVNGFIACVYHRKCSKCCQPCLFSNCTGCCCCVCCRCAFREPLVDADQYGEPRHRCCVSYRKRRKPYTVTDTHTTEENMELLPNNTENSISLDNSMLENIKSIKNTVETEVESQTEVKLNKRILSRVASTCDTIWMIVIFLIYAIVYIWISVRLF